QAANIIEALECGAECLLIDEDTSATNFMIRDRRMQELVSKDKEPITPFIDRALQLYEDHGVSSILVIGGSGDYFGIADKVIAMENYLPYDLTERAKEISKQTVRKKEGRENFGSITERTPVKDSIDPMKGRKAKVKAQGREAIQFGEERIELSSIEQLADESQTRGIAKAILYAKRYMDKNSTLNEVLEKVLADIKNEGLDIIEKRSGSLARFRKHELASAVNRLRTLKVKQD
ncbi:MAG: P-loop domain-containing protein, partial [Nanobdellota archaeon]